MVRNLSKNRRTASLRSFCRLEFALLVAATVFVTQVCWVSVRLHQLRTPTSDYSLNHGVLDGVVGSREAEAKGSLALNIAGSKKEGSKPKKGTQKTPKKGKKKKKKWKESHWDPGRELNGDPVPLKIGLPVVALSLPKSGTTSIWQYFNCGGYLSSHQWIKVNETYSEQSGKCIRRNLENGRPALDNCGPYDVYTDTGFANYIPELLSSDCYYPSIDALEAIYQQYPNVTFVMVIRDTRSWYNSMSSWGEGSLLARWRYCNKEGFPDKHSTADDFMRFYDWHTNNIREFVRDHPSLKYVEVELEAKETGQILERVIGIPAQCWGKCTPYSKFCKKIK